MSAQTEYQLRVFHSADFQTESLAILIAIILALPKANICRGVPFEIKAGSAILQNPREILPFG